MEGRSYQVESINVFSPPRPLLWLVVVDDVPDFYGQEMRQLLASGLNGWADAHHSWDPARLTPRHIEVLLISSSNPTWALHPGNLPALRLKAADATSFSAAAWESSVAQGLESFSAQQEVPPKYFDVLRYWLDILNHRAAAPDPESQAFVDALPGELAIDAYIAAVRDDASEGGVPELRIGDVEVLEAACSHPGLAFDARLEKFFWVEPCSNYLFRPRETTESGGDCQDGALAIRENGQRACRVMGYVDPNSACPSAWGWVDPENGVGVREPTVVFGTPFITDQPFRVCELLQLQGAALASCESDVACDECTPGWCFGDSDLTGDTDWLRKSCASQSKWVWGQMRFVLGADTAVSGMVEILCEMATLP